MRPEWAPVREASPETGQRPACAFYRRARYLTTAGPRIRNICTQRFSSLPPRRSLLHALPPQSTVGRAASIASRYKTLSIPQLSPDAACSVVRGLAVSDGKVYAIPLAHRDVPPP